MTTSLERIVSQLSKHIEGITPTNETVTLDFKMSRFYSPVNDASVESNINAFVKAMTTYEYLKLVAPNEPYSTSSKRSNT